MGLGISIVLAIIIGVELIVLEHTFFDVTYFGGCSNAIKGFLAPVVTSFCIVMIIQPPVGFLIFLAIVLGIIVALVKRK